MNTQNNGCDFTVKDTFNRTNSMLFSKSDFGENEISTKSLINSIS